MIMQDQSRRLSQPLQWGRRERVVVGALLGCVVAALIGLSIYAVTNSGTPLGKGCIELTFASTLGVAQIHDCGAQARALCASPTPSRQIVDELREDCKKAGYPFGTG
jgi:hypothetical protein